MGWLFGLVLLLVGFLFGYFVFQSQADMFLQSGKWCDERFGVGGWDYYPADARECGAAYGDCWVCKPFNQTTRGLTR